MIEALVRTYTTVSVSLFVLIIVCAIIAREIDKKVKNDINNNKVPDVHQVNVIIAFSTMTGIFISFFITIQILYFGLQPVYEKLKVVYPNI